MLRPASGNDAPRVAQLLIDARSRLMPYAPSAHRDDEVGKWVEHCPDVLYELGASR